MTNTRLIAVYVKITQTHCS